MKMFRSITLLSVGFLSILNCFGAKDSITFNLSTTENSEEIFFKEHKHRSRIITNAETLQLNGSCSDLSVPFILLSQNKNLFPIYPDKGSFSKDLYLEDGSNQLLATLPNGYSEKKKFEIIRLKPATFDSIEFLKKGSQPETADLGQPEAISKTYNIPTPNIVITGQRAIPHQAEISVKDHYGNPIIVETKEDQFFVHYTLREGQNTLNFRSSFENEVFQQEKLRFNLENVISLLPDSNKNPNEFIHKGMMSYRYDCHSETIFLSGHIDAIATGEITLSVNNKKQSVPVKNHNYSTEVSLESHQTNTIKASAKVGDQSFFDYIEVSHIAPEFILTSMSELMLNGGNLEESNDLESENTSYTCNTGAFKIEGDVSFLGEINVEIHNQATGKTYFASKKSGLFSKQITLSEGKNPITILLGNGEKKLTLFSLNVEFENAIIIDQINQQTYSDEPIELSENSCQLKGRVSSVKKGFLHVKSEQQSYSIPIIDGKFEMEEALSLNPGENTLILTYKIQNQSYEKKLVVVTPELVEEENES